MTSRLLIAPQARNDLRAAWDYIAVEQQSPLAADRLLDRLRTAFSTLAAQPMLGQARPDLAPGLRAFVVKRYVILYCTSPGCVEILRVIHSARDLAALLYNSPSPQ